MKRLARLMTGIPFGGSVVSLRLRKIVAFLSVCLTAVGIFLSLFFIFEIWRYRQPVTEKLQTGVDQFSSMLQISNDGLGVVDQVVKNVYTSTIYLDEATLAFSQTIRSSSQFMDSAGTLVGDNLLTTITNTQTALGSAQASAKVIDNLLTTLSRVPLIGINYKPAVPLNTALGNVADSLDPIQSSLENFQTSLYSTSTNLQEFSDQIAALDKNILSIQENLTQAQATINKYRTQIATLHTWLADVKTNLPTWTKILAWILSLVIVWMIIIQVALALQGVSQIRAPRTAEVTPNNSE
jgi:hypothetical protein